MEVKGFWVRGRVLLMCMYDGMVCRGGFGEIEVKR